MCTLQSWHCIPSQLWMSGPVCGGILAWATVDSGTDSSAVSLAEGGVESSRAKAFPSAYPFLPAALEEATGGRLALVWLAS